MFGLLDLIANTVAAFGQLVLWGLVSGINLLVAALGGAIGAVLSLLPNLPDVPENPAPDASGWIAFFIPSQLIVLFTLGMVATYVGFLAIRIMLKWARAL